MWPYEKISNLLPESGFKNRIRTLFYRVLYSFTLGSKEVLLNNKDKIKGKFCKLALMEEYKHQEETEGYIRHYRPKRGDVVIDAGAFHGHFSIYASKLVGMAGKVICFEPDKASFNLLKKNIRLNKLKNVITINKGLWSEKTELSFESRGDASKTSRLENTGVLVNRIKVVKLDEILSELRIRKVNFVKMDVEGDELQIIDGAREIMKKQDIHFAIASYHIVNNEKTCFQLEKLFKKRGYNSFTEYPQHLTTYACKKQRYKKQSK